MGPLTQLENLMDRSWLHEEWSVPPNDEWLTRPAASRLGGEVVNDGFGAFAGAKEIARLRSRLAGVEKALAEYDKPCDRTDGHFHDDWECDAKDHAGDRFARTVRAMLSDSHASL